MGEAREKQCVLPITACCLLPFSDSKTGDTRDDAKNDTGCVGNGDRQIARRFEQPVNHPQRAVNRGAKRLDGACLMSGEILLNLENIGCVHTDCGNGGNYGQNTDVFVVHKYSSCK